MKYKISFLNKDAQNYYIVHLVDDKQKIINRGNTERFVDCIVGKWVLINRDTNRIENDINPHIEDLLDNNQINNWRLDGWSYINEDYFRLSDIADCGIFEIDFETGKYKRIIAKGEARCQSCGRYIKRKLIYGKYCRDCLTCSGGLAYQYCYHDYYGGYDLPDKYDVDKQPLFGCEIERDYSTRNNNGSFNNNLKDSMVDIVKIFHKQELKDGNLKRQNVFMRDGSLYNDGLEWITFPHTFNWYVKNKNKFKEALEVIKNRGFCASSRAGNHIHINRAFFGDDAEFCAAKMSILFNTYWDEYVAISGR